MTIAWASFTPWLALSGGVLIGLSATLLWLGMGRIAGISGIAGSLFSLKAASGDRAWRWLFLIGLIAGAFIVHLLTGGLFEVRSGYPIWLLVGGALLVGIGTRMGSGCTSGHGVCGLARLSMRGLVATLTFMGTAFVTVFVIRHLLGFGGSA
ncbi:MAG: YeeE/YedE family protein [Wenzhouxiangellaceae bacterium]|nr:MAG: YeeE/YedE family protein [Wenzhouxiangellaceae bacterium]